jgi:hypothetical protein
MGGSLLVPPHHLFLSATLEATEAVQIVILGKLFLEWKQWNRQSPLKHNVLMTRDGNDPDLQYN